MIWTTKCYLLIDLRITLTCTNVLSNSLLIILSDQYSNCYS